MFTKDLQNFDESSPPRDVIPMFRLYLTFIVRSSVKKFYCFKTWEVLWCTKDKLWALDADMRLLFIEIGIEDGSLR